jgi:hypothetical protein
MSTATAEGSSSALACSETITRNLEVLARKAMLLREQEAKLLAAATRLRASVRELERRSAAPACGLPDCPRCRVAKGARHGGPGRSA